MGDDCSPSFNGLQRLASANESMVLICQGTVRRASGASQGDAFTTLKGSFR